MDIKTEELKILIAHRALHRALKRSVFGYNDRGWHNTRAILINRIEQNSGHKLRVLLDGSDPESIPKIVSKEEFFQLKYGEKVKE